MSRDEVEHTKELFERTKAQTNLLLQNIKRLETKFKQEPTSELVEENITEIHDTLLELNRFLSLEF